MTGCTSKLLGFDMGDIVSFPERADPHLSGEAVCLSCRHKWVCVAPVGVWQLECPSCGCMKGIFRLPVGADRHESSFVCKCGCEAMTVYFRKGQTVIGCMNCGIDHTATISQWT